jgi:hypothetical protein
MMVFKMEILQVLGEGVDDVLQVEIHGSIEGNVVQVGGEILMMVHS